MLRGECVKNTPLFAVIYEGWGASMVKSTFIDGVSKSSNSDDDIFQANDDNFSPSTQSFASPVVVISPLFPANLRARPICPQQLDPFPDV